MSEDKIKNIINNSGNDLHQDIVDFLREKDWEIKSSPYYNDPATNKPREIDVIAKKKFEVHDNFFKPTSDSLTVRLFIECKYVKNPNVFWFEKKNIVKAENLAKDNSVLRNIKYSSELQDLSKIPPKIYHYIQEADVAKRWDKSGNTDPFYGAVNGCLNGLIFFQEHQYSKDPNTIDYPIIIVNDFSQLHRRDNKNKLGYSAITENFQIEIDYSFTNKDKKPTTKYFLLDVVQKDGLENFLNHLEINNVSILTNRLYLNLQENAYEDQARYTNFNPYL